MIRQEVILQNLNKTLKAMELRLAGFSYADISEQLGYKSRVGAFKAVQRALKATLREPTDDVRELELGRLDVMLRSIWEKVEGGQLAAIDRAIKIVERRARMLGLDTAQKFEFNFERMSDAELAEYITRTITEIGSGSGDSKTERTEA